MKKINNTNIKVLKYQLINTYQNNDLEVIVSPIIFIIFAPDLKTTARCE